MKTLMLLILTTICLTGAAQDPHFSHIHASPLHNNPAWTGVFNNQFRVITNYRNQWKTPTANFNTFSLSFDASYRIPKTRIAMNAGVSFMTDNGGDLNYGMNNYNLMAGTTLPLGGKGRNYITLGAQIGMISQHIDLSNVQSLDMEPLMNTIDPSSKMLDVSAGIGYFYSLSKTKTIYAGVALYHINSPNVSLVDVNNVDLYKRWVANLGGMWDITRKIAIQPSAILYWQGPHKEITPGSFVSIQLTDTRYGFQHDMKLHVGVWARYYISSEYRSGFDALIFSSRYDLDHLSFSFSTDITFSKLAEASTFIGSPELSVIYTFSRKSVKKIKARMECPVF